MDAFLLHRSSHQRRYGTGDDDDQMIGQGGGRSYLFSSNEKVLNSDWTGGGGVKLSWPRD